MKKNILGLMLSILCFNYSQAQGAFLPGEFIVQLAYKEDIEEIMKRVNEKLPDLFVESVLSQRFNIWLIKGYKENEHSVLDELRRVKGIEIAQLNHVVYNRETIPNDPSFTQQWSMKNTGQNNGLVGADIDATLAWDITTGGVTALGDTIVVAVIDDGFQLNHPDLQQNFFRNRFEVPGNGVDDDGNGYIDDINGWNANQNNGTITAAQHGTHVSGIIGARGNNGVGVTGVNWNVKVLPIRGSSGNEATVVAAYSYAAAMRILYDETNGQRGAFVVATNSSFGVDLANPADYPIWCAFYDTLGSYGILSAGATANANYNIDVQGDVPTACASQFLVSVTNSTRNDVKTTQAGYGITTIDIAAPGSDIYNTVTNGGYSSLSGTSMATPHVAGAIGLLYSGACDQFILDYKNNPAAMALIMKDYLLNGADQLPSLNNLVAGSRRLNVYQSLILLQTYICNAEAPPLANFNASGRVGCPNLVVTFNNVSSLNADSYQWSFPGGSPASSTLQSPTVTYSTFGSFDVQLIATNEFGSDTTVFSNYIVVTNTGIKEVFVENFEQGVGSLSSWQIENPDGANTWAISTVTGTSPGNNAVGINIFNNQDRAGARDRLISPSIDLTQTTSNQLSFVHAHRRRTTNQRDSLIVRISADDGLTFPYTILSRAENGQGTLATAALLNSNFVPSQQSDWCLSGTVGTSCFTLDLSAFDGNTIKIMFESFNNAGNNIYIDNIRVSGVCSVPVFIEPVAAFEAQSNEVCAGSGVTFLNTSLNAAQFQWTFEGGTPPTSTIFSPTIQYNQPGVYSVGLIAISPGGSDSITQQSFIQVFGNPETPVIVNNDNILSTDSNGSLQWFLNGQIIQGANQSSLATTQNGTYTVVVTNENGCSSTSIPSLVTTTNLKNLNIDSEVMLFPNPAKSGFVIQTNGKSSWNYEILDISGRLIRAEANVQDSQVVMDRSGWSDGVYIVKVFANNRLAIMKLILSH